MTADFAVVDLESVPEEPFPESGLLHRKLTDSLGCEEMHVNAITLQPGEATTPHAHERQEEVYVALDGGQIELEGKVQEVSPGGVVRIGPEPVRSVRNDSVGSQTWLLFGAPLLGTIDDFGEYTVPED